MSSFGPHLLAGTVVGGIGTTATIVGMPEFSAMCFLPFVAGVAGALTPDMDIKSKSSMFMYLLYVVTASILFVCGYPGWAFLLLVYSLIPQFFGHRGFIHSFVFGLLSTVGLGVICAYNGIEMGITAGIVGSYFFGFLTHIVLDET